MACCNLSVIIVRLSLLFLAPSLTGIFFFFLKGGGRGGKYHLAAISIKDWLFLSYSLVSNP